MTEKVFWWVQPVTITAGRRYIYRWTPKPESPLTEAQESGTLYDNKKKAEKAALEELGESL